MATKRRVECDSAPSCAIPENQEANSEIQQLLARALANSQAEKEYKHYTAISYKKQARRYVIKVSIRRTSNCIYNAQILCIHACIHVHVYTCNLANWFSALIILLSTKNIPLYHLPSLQVRTDQNREQYIHVRLRDGKQITAFGIEEGKTLEDSLKL